MATIQTPLVMPVGLETRDSTKYQSVQNRRRARAQAMAIIQRGAAYIAAASLLAPPAMMSSGTSNLSASYREFRMKLADGLYMKSAVVVALISGGDITVQATSDTDATGDTITVSSSPFDIVPVELVIDIGPGTAKSPGSENVLVQAKQNSGTGGRFHGFTVLPLPVSGSITV